jgi:hypothetical protein
LAFFAEGSEKGEVFALERVIWVSALVVQENRLELAS